MRKLLAKRLYLLSFILLICSCSFGPYYEKSVRNWKSVSASDSAKNYYSVYLIGDAGSPSLNTKEPTLKLLESFITKDPASSTVFLGDNIYFDGMPAPGASGRELAEKKLNEQLNILKNYKGEVYFIAGNHDWDYQREDGLAKIKFQEEYIEAYLNRGNTFIPDHGCPGPFSVKINSNVILIAIDSQWWLHKYSKPYGRCGDCEAEDEEDMLIQLEDIIKNNRNKNIVLVAHHPILSNGNHGGYYNILDYIFPLHVIHPKWYLPLPVIGSIYPLYRKLGGVDQDMPHYRYQEFIYSITNIIQNYDNVIYAAGHDHNLQYLKNEKVNQVVSGSGSKITPVKGGGAALYTHKHNGFAIIKYYDNGETWIEYWIPEGDGNKGQLAFKYQVYTRKTGAHESYCSLSAIDYSDSTFTVKASEKYQAKNFRKFVLGNHYRKEWTTPITVPLIDLKTAKEGLIPYGIGGRNQSISLKLKNVDEREFVLRSVNKNPEKVLPESFRNTFVQDIVEDQISAQHPYASLTVPPLEDAVKVYHTNHELVLIPNDSCLGPYREQFKNMLAFFEEDPDENHENVRSLGYSENIVGTDKMREMIESDNDYKLDERNFLRLRFIDMLIGDWDRHERQYRWATLDTGKGKLYRAVPEDRDQAYFKFDGIIPYIASRKWAMRSLQNFDYEFNDIIGLNTVAKNIDRRYLSSLNRNDWKEISDSIKIVLTDSIIEAAVKKLPPEVFTIHGEEIIAKLKSRRDKLQQAIMKYYEALAKYVDIFGTDKNEKFIIERINNSETKVSIYKLNKDGEVKRKLYERVFYSKETKEIRLYGLSGEDDFELKGKVKKGIIVRIIGGKDSDTLRNDSKVKGIAEKTFFYDLKGENIIQNKKETNLRLSKAETVNYPNKDKFFYNYRGPKYSIAYNQDDGFFIGLGAVIRNYKFRSDPYGSQHTFLASHATFTNSTKLDYIGDIRGVTRFFDLGIVFDMYTPAFVMNYFGYGNDSQKIPGKKIEFYRTRLEQLIFNPSIKKDIAKYFTVGIGPKYQRFDLQYNPNTYLGETIHNPEIYSPRQYAGLRAYFKLGSRDNFKNPTRGILFTGEVNQNWRLDKKESYSQYLSEFSIYLTPNLPFQLTFASRVGGAMNFGTYEFFQANTLGYTSGIGQAGNLRGFRKTRFIGDKSFYNNTEIRAEVLKLNTYFFRSKVGVLALLDNGRVWVENQHSKKWHTGYGGGIWIDIYKQFVVTLTYSISNEDKLVNARLGFLF